MGKALERKLNVLYDFLYVIRNARMAKRIRSEEPISLKNIREKLNGINRLPGLTREQFRSVQEYYYPYKVSTLAHRETLALTGVFDPSILPHEMYYAYVDPYLNDRKRCRGLEHKCLFPRLFPGITQPDSIAFRMNGLWIDEENKQLSQTEVRERISREDELFIKQADDSFGGNGIVHYKRTLGSGTELDEILNGFKGDIIIQRPVRQHAALARLNPSSVNTLRVCSYLSGDGVNICGMAVRFATGDKSVDNVVSGGMMCAVDKNGCLKKYAYSFTERTDVHPKTGVRFEGYKIPSYEKIIALVKKAHPMLPFSRLVGFDVAVREDGEPVLIEANLSTMGLEIIEFALEGSLFGEDTRRIVDEVLQDSDYPRRRERKHKYYEEQ